MDGLIDGARQQLWDTVAQLGRSPNHPTLRVGLISYGNTGYDAAPGWVRAGQRSDRGPRRRLRQALRPAHRRRRGVRGPRDARGRLTASWEQGQGTRRMLVVAGNEPANQDPQIPLARALVEARERGIVVSTIYCGSESNGEAGLWRNLAQQGGGQFAAIDHNTAVAVATPGGLRAGAALGQALNRTYVSYGRAGAARAQNQALQDSNAGALGAPAAATRAVAKSSALYRNSDWDLVDASKDGKLASIKEEDLPEELRRLPAPERADWLSRKSAERAEIQRRITDLSQQASPTSRPPRRPRRGPEGLRRRHEKPEAGVGAGSLLPGSRTG